MAIAGCRNFNWAPTEALDKVSTTPPNTVVAPVFAPAGGSYNATQNVTLTTSTSGATICFRNDGTNADCDSATGTCFAGSTTYVGSISVPATITLNAMACKATMNNSVIATAVYSIDSTAPVISAIAPTTGSFVTNTQVSYTLSETCGTGSITWTRTSGTADPGSPRVQALVGAELTAGTHTAVTLTNNPALVNGTVYDITFNCTDAAGNAATPLTSTNVTFDNVAPVISGVAPTTGSFRVNTQVSYTLSEDCQTGSITWTRTGGAADGASPHVQTLAGLELTQGTKTNLTLGNNPALVSGAIYTIDFACQDFAGQNATTITSTGVTFDNVAPIISGVSPMDSAFVSTTQVSYDLTEACASASITWTRTGGSVDPGSPHVQALTAGEMTAITHSNITITNNPTLIDGAIYSLDFNCTDATGNVATTVSRTNITYDPSAVVISAVSPAGSTFRNNTQVSYTLSENCASGNITWTRTGGNPDAGSPRVQALTGTELTAGTKTNITLTNNPPLVDGAVYSVQFNCTDFAANASTPITVTNVTYDFTAPAISGTAPATGTFRNNNLVSFTYTENCATASITWTQTSGTADPSSPHVQAITGADLNAGAHNGIIIANNPTLADGAVYTMAFACSDAAGNAATVISNTGITFDYTAPTVTLTNLRNNGTAHTRFAIGTANDNVSVTAVQVSVDSASFVNAVGTATWKYALPPNTWADRSSHSLQIIATDAAGNTSATIAISVFAGNNRDINGDGIVDFAVGANKFTGGTPTGKLYIFYGNALGLPGGNANLAPTKITGEVGNDNFARNSVIADFNGDGFGDLAVGSSAFDMVGPTITDAGRVYIFNGSPTGITQTLASGANRIINGNLAAAQFGTNVIAGDTDGDGYADLVAGAPGYTTNTGRVYIFTGGAGGIAATSVTGAAQVFTGQGTNSDFGSSMTLGDYNGDGYTDLAVGAPAYPTAGNNGRGYLFLGSVSGIFGATATNGLAFGTGTAAEAFTGALSSGDINGDGYSDLISGSYAHATNTGRMYIYYGNAGSIPLNMTGGVGSPSTVITGPNSGAFFTTSISAGDLNSDGYSDIAVGAYGCTSNPGGCAYVFYGAAGTLSGTTVAAAGFLGSAENPGDNFGRSVSSADMNGDGYADLLVGANFFLSGARNGSSYAFHSNSGGPVGGSANSKYTGENANDEYGISINR